MVDLNAVGSHEISVKLRLSATNAKLERSPANIMAAIATLMTEYSDLMGIEDMAYEVSGLTATMYAEDRYMGQPTTENVIQLAVECLVNMPTRVIDDKLDATARAKIIVAELNDMELID